MLPLVELKVAVAVPAVTVTEAGTVNIALLLESVTAAPPVGADLLRVTVHALVALGPRVAGTHASEDISTGATRLMVALLVLPL